MYHRIFGCLFLGLVSVLPVAGNLVHAAAQDSAAKPHYLTAVERAGERLIAVGERGVILLSDDDGANWRQVDSGNDVTLTGLTALDPQHIWVVGHEGTLLRSDDGGEHWAPVLRGVAAAQLALAEVRHLKASPVSAQAQPLIDGLERNAERMIETGSSEPLFSIQFTDSQHGLAVGAYGVVLRTQDGGRTWAAVLGHVDNPRNLHLYALANVQGSLYLAGEQGFLARSSDQGEHFARLDSGASASFFTLTEDAQGGIYAGGLEGVALRSSDQGATWQALTGGLKQSWVASRPGPDDSVIFANANGALFHTAKDAALIPLARSNGGPLSDFVASPTGATTVVGPGGVTHALKAVSDNAVLEAQQ
ncbi:WD40/YVTN/BNR-like repeat-containing protein [Pseudomonas sp. NPDC088368]|jgi:photosystem II stability/assembly factor-like uncharacterized protein|uniref:WD40/YVTN/BNR-like repeat-containing protein n=1 Tax=Pseudomonas sp. NPDC088368 TaxID=3364453 RepID=UPI0037F3583C